MFPFLSLTETERESVLKHVGIKEKLALMRFDRYFREYVFKLGPWPERVERLTIGYNPKPPGIPVEDCDACFFEMIIDKDKHRLSFRLPPAFMCKTMKHPMKWFPDPSHILVCADDEQRLAAMYTLLGKIRSCEKFVIDYDRETPIKDMIDIITQFLECFKSKGNRLIYDLRISSSLPVIRQLLDGLNVKVINSCIISLPFLTDLHVGARKDANPKEINKIRKYFTEALQKPIFSDCRMFATDNVMNMFADGLKKANFKMIYSQEGVMEGFWAAIAIILTKGLPNDQSLTVLSTGYCYGAAYKKRAYSKYNLNRYTTKIGRKYGLVKIESDSDEAKMMLELVVDPRKNDCSYFEAWKWQNFRGSKNFPFDFSKKTKLFYKKRIESAGKTLVMMASLHDVFNGCETVVYLFRYSPIIEVTLF